MGVGLGTGYLLSWMYPQQFESQTVISVQPRAQIVLEELPAGVVDESELHHSELIGSEMMVKACFEYNDLFQLDEWDGINRKVVIEQVYENLSVEEQTEDQSIFSIRLRCKDRMSAKVVLACLVSTYDKQLDDRFRHSMQTAYSHLLSVQAQLQEMHKEAREGIASIKQKNAESDAEGDGEELESWTRQRDLVEAKLLDNRLMLEQFELNRSVRDFSLMALQQASDGKRVGTSFAAFLLLGGGIGALVGALIGLGGNILVRSLFS